MQRLKKIISCWLVICMLVTMIPANVFAATQEKEGYMLLEGETREMPPISTSADALSAFSLDENGNPEIKDSNEVRWIDRLADLPEYVVEFYEWLEENSDGDRVEDALINPTTGMDLEKDNNTFVHQAAKVNGGELEYTFTPGASEAEIKEAAGAAVYDVVFDFIDTVDPYIFSAFCAFDRDHPEVFWLSGESQFRYGVNYHYSYDSNMDGVGTVDYDVTFYFVLLAREEFDIRAVKYRSYTEIYNAIEDRDEWVENILTDASGNYEEKARYFNEWLTKNNCYNTSEEGSTIDIDCLECLSALEGSAGTEGPICEGYSRAFKVLCDKSGIPCVLVNGEALGGDHMWNYVQMDDGKWYAVDVTWNDPTVPGVTDKISEYENEDYFLVGSNTYNELDEMTFGESHILNNIVADGGVAFTNGPALEAEAYVPHEHGNLELVEGFEATCIKEGQKSYYVCECGKWFEDEEGTILIEDHDSVIIPMTDHTYKSATAEPTCTEEGYTIHTCSVCNHSYIDSYVDPTGHSFSEWGVTKNPTCTEKGEETRSCACGEIEIRELGLIDHAYDTEPEFVWSNDSRSCTAVFTCSFGCGVDLEMECDVTAESDDATCTTEGTVKFTATCDWNEQTYSDSKTVKGVILDHDYVVEFKWYDENTVCYAQIYCTRCEEIDETITCDVTTEKVAKGILYTATCEFEGKEYEDSVLKFIFPFTDVSEDAWYYDEVKYVFEHDLMNGTTETTFNPDMNLTRSMFATILYRLNGKPSVEYKDTFKDVPNGEWYTDGVIWAYENGIVNGYDDEVFGTEDNITREQIAVMMYRYANYMKYDITQTAEFDQYEDADQISVWAEEAMHWAVGCGLISGKTNTILDPLGDADRAECATIIMRFDQLYEE